MMYVRGDIGDPDGVFPCNIHSFANSKDDIAAYALAEAMGAAGAWNLSGVGVLSRSRGSGCGRSAAIFEEARNETRALAVFWRPPWGEGIRRVRKNCNRTYWVDACLRTASWSPVEAGRFFSLWQP